MKKYLLVICLLFFLIQVKTINAQVTPTPISKSTSNYNTILPLVGITCGNPDANDETIKCCYLNKNSIKEILIEMPRFGCLTIPLAGEKCVSDFADELKNKLIDIALNVPPFSNIFALQEKYNQPCASGVPSSTNYGDPDCVCKKDATSPLTITLCDKYLSKSNDYGGCVKCFADQGIWTALGCMYINNMETFVTKNIFGIGIGLAGIISLLCIIYSAFSLQMSVGNPEKVKKTQQLLTSCITGLMLIIFSVFILRFIGINVLKIPGMK